MVQSRGNVGTITGTAISGTTYYVRTDGSNGNTGLANTSGGAWLTMDWAADHVVAGDTIKVQPGTYAERPTPGVSGTFGSPITFLADGAVTFKGMDVTDKNYIRVVGFTVDTDAGGGAKSSRAFDMNGSNTGWEFWNNTIRDATGQGIANAAVSDRSHNFIIVGNTFTAIGGGGSNGTAVSIIGNDNLIAYNDIDSVDPDAFYVYGQHNRWLNNYIHNVVDSSDLHSDVFQAGSHTLGLSDNIFEANFVVGAGNLPNEHGTLIQWQDNNGSSRCEGGACGAMAENLFRRNVWHNISGGELTTNETQYGPITETRQVHDHVVDVMRNASSTEYSTLFYGTNTSSGRVHNTIFHRGWGDSVTSNVQVYHAEGSGAILSADYNLSFTPTGTPTHTTPWTSQAHPQTNVDPVFVNHATDDFTLQSGSGARGVAGPLTTTSGSGTGTTFNVATGGGGFFRGPNTSVSRSGGTLTAGDVITVGTDTVTVVSVAGDAITVTPSFTWANGDAVYLGDDTTPDIGAYPYKAGGYALSATYSIVGGTATITPNDTSLVRFVVAYNNGIPIAVMNASPYTCSSGAGTFSASVYPLYPSKTLFATATP